MKDGDGENQVGNATRNESRSARRSLCHWQLIFASPQILVLADDCNAVSLDYYNKMPLKFNGTIEPVNVEYVTEKKDIAESQRAAAARG